MARKDRLEETLAHLRAMASSPPSEDGLEELRNHLHKGKQHAAAKAAEIASSWKAHELIPDLVAAFQRFMKQPEKIDKGCVGKLAIVECLEELHYEGEDLYLTGIRHVQMEPVYAGRADTAPGLRGACAKALAAISYPEAHLELATLLADPEVEARREAVRILTWLADNESELLLRMRALTRDPDPAVMEGCFTGLITIAPARSVDFVAPFLDEKENAIADGAALALGESRLPEAFAHLRAAWDKAVLAPRKKPLLLPMALLRSEEAFQFLLEAVRIEHTGLAEEAICVLAVYASDPPRRQAVADAVDERDEKPITAEFQREFPPADA